MAHFRKNMSGVHTWAGLLLGWLLLWMFITGTLGYFDTELDRWMKPELPIAPTQYDEAHVARTAQDYLTREAPDASRWVIFFPIDRNEPYLRVFWSGVDEAKRYITETRLLDLHSGAPLEARDTGGGQLLYKMHWRLHYMPRALAEIITGSAAMLMLLALITGIIIHRNIFRDIFTFRLSKGRRTWLDLHNLVAVTSLPYQLMITYSGLIFVMFTYMPLVFVSFYGTDAQGRRDFFNAVSTPEIAKPANQAGVLADLSTLVEQKNTIWPDTPIRNMDIRFPGDSHSSVILKSNNAVSPLRASDELVFSGVEGKLLTEQPANKNPTQATHDALLGLHEGLFAPPVLRWLYFFSGILGAMMMATGLIMWEHKRRQQGKSSPLGIWLVSRLNIASIAGMSLSIGAYFMANRLLPSTMTARAEWEVHIMFMSWLACLLHAALRPRYQAWLEQLILTGALFLCLPIVNAITTERGLISSMQHADWVIAGVDYAFLVTGALFLIGAYKVYERFTFSQDTRYKQRTANTNLYEANG